MSMLKPLLEKLVKPGVSDLHLKANEPPSIRMYGQLIPVGTNALSGTDVENIVYSVMDEHQKKVLHEKGSMDFGYSMEGVGRLRINVYRQRDTTAAAIRIVPLEPRSFTDLNLPADTLDRFCRARRGLILISGITGSGKTTTLNAFINHMNENMSCNIVTIEDPIEFSHPRKKSSISQRELGRDFFAYRAALESVFRQDPDVIVIGEMRTAEMFKLAIDGAASGHLVIGTLHSSDALDAVDRIVNVFNFEVQPYVRSQLAGVLTAVISQRLLLGKTGKLLVPATEIMLGTLQMKKLLVAANNAEAKYLIERGNAFGMHTFDQDLVRLVEEGVINGQEALNNASAPNDMRLKLQGQGGNIEGVK